MAMRSVWKSFIIPTFCVIINQSHKHVQKYRVIYKLSVYNVKVSARIINLIMIMLGKLSKLIVRIHGNFNVYNVLSSKLFIAQ